MEKIRQKLSALRVHWPWVLAACLALALAFGAGMSVQAALENAEKEAEIQDALSNFSRQMKIFSNDVDRITQEAQQAEAAGEPVDDPAKNYVFPSSLAFLREKAVAIADMAELPRSRQYSQRQSLFGVLETGAAGRRLRRRGGPRRDRDHLPSPVGHRDRPLL